MSARGGNRFFNQNRGPSQIFKKRYDLINTDIPINADATLLGTITLDETGTVYAIGLSLHAMSESGTSGDVQTIRLWIRCVPAGTALPDLTANAEIDTLNGFTPVTLFGLGGAGGGIAQYVSQKYRFRRKCDEATLLQLLGQSSTTQGTGRVVNIAGTFSAIVRVR